MLLPTVRSRCQHLRFGQLGAEEVADVLITSHGYSPAEAHAAAAASEGSVGAALEGELDTLVEARDVAARVLQNVAGTSDPRRRLDGAKALAGSADDRHLVNADLRALLRRLASSYDGARTTSAFAAVDRALEAVDRNASPKIVADWLAFQL
jgi:DNA polymerase-3 subunit delta'